MDVTH